MLSLFSSSQIRGFMVETKTKDQTFEGLFLLEKKKKKNQLKSNFLCIIHTHKFEYVWGGEAFNVYDIHYHFRQLNLT